MRRSNQIDEYSSASWPPAPTTQVPKVRHGRFSSPLVLARLLYGLIGGEIVLQIVIVLLNAISASRIGQALTGGCVLIIVVSYIVLLVWTYVTYRNLEVLDGSSRLKRPHKAVLAHLLPVTSLVVPFGIYDEMSQACALDTEPSKYSMIRSLPVALWLITYWIAISQVGYYSMSLMMSHAGGVFTIFSTSVLSSLALQNVFLLLTVRAITVRQMRKAHSLGLI